MHLFLEPYLTGGMLNGGLQAVTRSGFSTGGRFGRQRVAKHLHNILDFTSKPEADNIYSRALCRRSLPAPEAEDG